MSSGFTITTFPSTNAFVLSYSKGMQPMHKLRRKISSHTDELSAKEILDPGFIVCPTQPGLRETPPYWYTHCMYCGRYNV